MSDNLTQVMLEFSANFDSFDSALRRAETRATQASKLIEKDFKLSVSDKGVGQTLVKSAKEQQRLAKTAADYAANISLLASKRSLELTKQEAQQKLAISKLASKLETTQSKADQKYKLEVARIASNIELVNARKRNGEITAAAAKASIQQLNASKAAQKATLDASKKAAQDSYKAAVESERITSAGLKKATALKFDVKLDTLERVREASAGKQTSTLLRPLTKMVDVLGDVLSVGKDGNKKQEGTKKQVKKESSVSITNKLQGLVFDKVGNSFKNAFVKEFNVDLASLEKAFVKILPSSRMIADDFKQVSNNFLKVTGIGNNFSDLLGDLVTGFADATVEAKTTAEVFKRFKTASRGAADNYVNRTKSQLTNIKENPKEILKKSVFGENVGRQKKGFIDTLETLSSGRSAVRNVAKLVDKPLAERKDRKQDERLPFILQRAAEIAAADRKSKIPTDSPTKMGAVANALDVVTDSVEELILVAGGAASKKNTGKGRAGEINKQFVEQGTFDKKRAVGNTGKDTMIGDTEDPLLGLMPTARPNLRGFSRDAEEMTAQAVAALLKSDTLKVKIVGESAGGNVAEEVVRNLNKLGFGDRVSGVGFGTPALKTAQSRQPNFERVMGVNRREHLGFHTAGQMNDLGLTQAGVYGNKGRKKQNMRGLSGHTIDNYYGEDAFTSFVHGNEGRGQIKVSAKELKALEKSLMEKARAGKGGEVAMTLDNLEQNFNMTAPVREVFAGMKERLQKVRTDVDKGFYDQLKAIQDALDSIENPLREALSAGDLRIFADIEPTLASMKLSLLGLRHAVSDETIASVDAIEAVITNIRSFKPASGDPVEARIGFLLRETQEALKQLSDEQIKAASAGLLKGLKAAENEVKNSGSSESKDLLIKNLKKQQLAIRRIHKKVVSDTTPHVDRSDAWGEDTNREARLSKARADQERLTRTVRFKGALDREADINPFLQQKPTPTKQVPSGAKESKPKADTPLVAIKKDTSEIVNLLKGTKGSVDGFIKKFNNQEKKVQLRAQIDAKKTEPRKNNALGWLNGVVSGQVSASNPTFQHSAIQGSSNNQPRLSGGGALTKKEYQAEVLHVRQIQAAGGQLAVNEPEYHQTRKHEPGQLTVKNAMRESVKDLASFAVGLEQATLTVMPLGHVIKKIIQIAGVASVGVAASQIPGVGLAVDGVTTAGAGIIDAIAAGFAGVSGGVIEAAVTGSANAIAGAVAESGAIGSGMIADAIIVAGSHLGATAGAAGGAAVGAAADVGLTAGAVAIPALTAVKVTQDKLEAVSNAWLGDTTGAAKQGKLLGSNVKLLASNYKAQADLVRLDMRNIAEVKKLPATERNAKLGEQIYLLEQHIKQADIALAEAKGDSALTKEIKSERKKLKEMLKVRTKALGSETAPSIGANSEVAHKMRVIQQVGQAPDLGGQMRVKGQDFIDGFTLTVKASKEFGDAAEEAAKEAIKGFAKGQDSASPSKKMKRLAKDFKDGFVGTIQADGDFFSASRNAALHAIEGFNAPLASDGAIKVPSRQEELGVAAGENLLKGKKALETLMGNIRMPTADVNDFFTGFKQGFQATGVGAMKLKAQLASVATIAGFLLLKNQISTVGKALFNTALEMEVVQKKMNSVNMGGQDPFKTFDKSANKAGLSVKDYASNFAGMVQTMSRSVPNADKVFESITEGLNKRGVVGDAMTRSMEALSQISSKGVVSMEELRQQLGEALPGAMTIAADSMGMTNGQFMKMVESGELLSSDFLPKFGMALNNVAGGELPSLNTELQTAKNNIDGILAQSASTIPFTGALQSFNAIVSQSSDFLKILVPVVGVALVGAFVAAAGVIISTVPIIGAAFTAALPAAAWVAGIALAMTAMVEFVKYLKGAGTEFDKIGEKMEKALNPKVANRSKLAATGTIARLNDSLTSFFTPGQSSKFAEKETIEVRGQASRQIQKQQDAINKAAKKLTPDNVLATEKQVSPLVIQKQKLQIKLSNADALGLSQDAKKNITKSINDLDAEIKNIVEKNLGSEIDVNTTLKATLESKAVLEADAKARGEDVAVLYGAQYQNLVKQEQVLKSMVAQFAAVAGFSNNQLKAQKEMNAILSLGTKVSEKEGVMETLAAYKELESLTTTMAGFDSASMEIDIAVKEGAVKEIESQISSIDAFVSTSMGTAQEQVINKAFKNGWKKATAREIADFKVQIESGALGEVDKAVVSMVESLEKKSELEKELGQTNIDLIKANRQLEQALLDLNDARLNQQMQGNQTEMSLIQLVADLQKMSPENSKEVFDASNSNTEFRLQQQESLRNLSVSFRSFGESLTDAADNLKSGIASMNDEIRSTAASLKTTALNGATAFANAAGIEDTLGLGRLLDLASEKINIKASDKTASIERQQASENKTDKRQIRDFTEQREGLNREADRASMEIVRAIENNNFDMKDLEVNFELSGMQLQDKLDAAVRDVTGLERSTNEFNDRALGFGQAPVDVDISGLKNRLSQIQTMVTEEVDSGAIVQALYDLKVQQNADAQEFLSGIQATKVQGNQGLTQKINDITAFNKEKNVAFETQKGMEKERVELELDINDEKFQGTLVDIKRKLKEAGLAAVRSAEGVGLAVNDKLATVGLAADPYELLRMESKRWKRDTLADIDAQQKALKNTVDMLGEGGNTADNKLNVQANLNNSNLDAETKDSLLSQLASVKTAQEFEAYIKSVKDSLASLETSEKQVLSNADEIEARSIKLAKAKDLLAKNNTLTGEKQSFLDSVDTSRLSSGEERELELAKKKLKIAQDTANKIAQIDEDAMMQPDLYGGDVQKNRTNIALEAQANLLRKAQKEASILNDIYANMSSAGVDAIKSAILGIGEAILSNKPKQEEQDKLDADYAERLSSLVDGYTGSAEELQYAKNQLDEQRDDIQDEIETKLSKTAQIFDVLKGALSGFAQSIAQVAAQMAATAAIKGIAGAFGGGWGSLASSLIGGANMGGHAGVDVISNYSMGGTAGVADALALQAGISKAMRKEGQGAMPIVVHKGEQILSTRNGDAQLFRALKAQGEWDNIKQANVSNYANGGTAGYSGAAGGGSMVRRGMQSNSNTYYSSNVTVVANDIGSFKKNEQQLLRETEAAQTRSVRRGLG